MIEIEYITKRYLLYLATPLPALASQVLNEQLGALTRVEKNGHFVIRGAGCPLSAITGKHPGVCLAMESLVSEIVGAPVHECRIRDASPALSLQSHRFALAYQSAWLVLSRRPIDDVTIVESKLGAMPRAHDRSIFQCAFRQRASQMRAGMRQRTRAAMLPHQQ